MIKNFSPRAKTALILLAVIILIVIFRQQSGWVESAYRHGLYPVACYLLRPLLNIVPFSIGDLGYLCIIIAAIAALIRMVRYLITRRYSRLKQTALAAIITLQTLWLMFYLFWGLNYYRPPAVELLRLNDTTYTIKDVARVTSLIIDSANACRARLSTKDFQQNDEQIFLTARQAVQHLQGQSPEFDVIAPRIKPSLFSGPLNYMGTSGYYNPFSFEAQINNQMPIFDKPFVACHEMGHQAGWGREDEANFSGYIAGVQSPDRLLRYSTYYAGIEEFMRYLRRRDTVAHKALRQRISPLVIRDFKVDSAYWSRYSGGAQVVSGVFYDNFLKANNQPRGLRTYNRMILLTMAWYRKRYHVW